MHMTVVGATPHTVANDSTTSGEVVSMLQLALLDGMTKR